MTRSTDNSTTMEIFFGMYSDEKEGGKSGGHDHLFAFSFNSMERVDRL